MSAARKTDPVLDGNDAHAAYIKANSAFFRAARAYARKFNDFSDGVCSELELAMADLALSKAAVAMFEAAGWAPAKDTSR